MESEIKDAMENISRLETTIALLDLEIETANDEL